MNKERIRTIEELKSIGERWPIL